MVRDHTDNTRKLMAAASAGGVAMDKPTLGGDQAQMITNLETKTGPELDKEYVKQQMLAHRAALQVQTNYADNGSNGAIRAAARTAAPMVQGHLSMLQTMGPK